MIHRLNSQRVVHIFKKNSFIHLNIFRKFENSVIHFSNPQDSVPPMVHPLLAAFVSNEVLVSAELCYLCYCFVAKLWQLVIQWCNGMQSWVFVTQIEQINSMLSKFTELKCKWISYIWMKTIFLNVFWIKCMYQYHLFRYIKKKFFGTN